MNEDLVQMPLHIDANRHAKKSVKRKEELSEDLVQVKELEGDPMKAIYNVGHRSTRTVPLRRSRRTT